MENRGEVILYHPDNEIKLEVRLEDETVWLNRQQLSELFNRDVKTIGKHINNALKDAYKFATDLIRSSKKSILLIDNYVDESVLLMFSKRNADG